MRAIQINIPRPAVPVTDRDIDTINDPSRLRRDPTFARLIRPALLGLAGHLDTLAHADIPELDELWISLMNMLVRSLLGDQSPRSPPPLDSRTQRTSAGSAAPATASPQRAPRPTSCHDTPWLALL